MSVWAFQAASVVFPLWSSIQSQTMTDGYGSGKLVSAAVLLCQCVQRKKMRE